MSGVSFALLLEVKGKKDEDFNCNEDKTCVKVITAVLLRFRSKKAYVNHLVHNDVKN